MLALILVPGLSFVTCLALIPVARSIALKMGLVDRPDGRRKIHSHAVPVTGGLAIFSSLWMAISVATVVPSPFQEALVERNHLLLGLFLGSFVLLAIGLTDDISPWRGKNKLIGQIVAVLVVMSFGVNIEAVHLFGSKFELRILSWPFTCCLLLGAINSINLLDGMDGMLGCIGLWLSLALAAMAALALHWWAVLPALALAGALLGFLRYNLPPASIFMGDAGSMVVGLMLGTLAIQCSLKAPTTMAFLFPLGLMTMPFFDTTAAVVRRKLTGRSIYSTDRGHIHHCLLGKGFSTSVVLIIVSVCCLATCAGVLASQAFNNEWIVLLTTFSIIGFLVFTRMFGFAEAMLIKDHAASLIQLNKKSTQIEIRLQGTGEWQRLWTSLMDESNQLDLQQMILDINAPALQEGYHARWTRSHEVDEAPNIWRFEIPLKSSNGQSIGRLQIAGQSDGTPVWTKIARLTSVVSDYTNGSGNVVGLPSIEFANPVSVTL